MKKRVIVVACALLFCGGLFCLHLVTQSKGGLWAYGALVFDEIPDDDTQTEPASLLERKLDECNERELLELKVASYRKIARSLAALSQVGHPSGSAVRLAESHADLAAATIELYRYTGEQEKLRIALQARVEALTDKLRAMYNAYEADMTTLDVVCKAETQLLDALLEQKREKNKEHAIPHP